MNVIERIMSYLGLEEDTDDGEEGYEIYQPDRYGNPAKQKPKVVNIHANSHVKMIVSKPTSYDEVTRICDELKSRKPVILNLQSVDAKEAERILDFLAGALYAVEGVMQKVSKGVFLIVPNNVDIEGILEDEN